MILVTGGTGLVGSHLLLELLRSGEKVRALYRNSQKWDTVLKVFSYSLSMKEAKSLFNRIEWIQADLTEIPGLEIAFEGVTRVYHCGAHVSFDPSKDALLRKINIEGTANIVNLSIHHRINKLCFVSSIATLDKRPDHTSVSENSHWNKENDHTMYAITKYGAEMEVWRASQEGVPVVIVNPGIIIGPGFWENGSGQIFSKVNKGLQYHFPKTTGFVGVEDVVQVMIQLMNSSVRNEQFIVVSENLSFRNILRETARVLGKPEPSKPLKPWMVYLGWISEKFTSPFIRKERKLNRWSATTLFEDTFYSNDKVRERLDYNFEPISQVIYRTSQMFRKEIKD